MQRLLLALLTCSLSAAMVERSSADVARAPVPAAIVRGRDLRAYDYGGSFETPPNSRHIDNISSLRAFVWSHWSQRRRGYVKISFVGKDSDSECYLFAEPRGSGWRIGWETIQHGIGNHAVVEKPDEIISVRRNGRALLLLDRQGNLVFNL